MDYRMTNLKQAGLLAALTIALASCGGESQFPEPTGKGSFRAINAISTSPSIDFRLEETSPNAITYRNATTTRRFDDFEYNFNFEVRFASPFPEPADLRRVAIATQRIDANRDYTLVATGSVASPTIITWEADERTFDEGGTVSQIRLAHLAESLGEADVYFTPEGSTPVLGEERGTYSYGQVLPPFDIEQGNFTVTVTAPDDPSTVLYVSSLSGYVAGSALIVAIFDGTADDLAPVRARAIEAGSGTSASLPDSRFDSSIRFVQGAQSMGTVDIYDDEALTNRIVAGLPYGGFSEEVLRPVGNQTFRYTPADSTETILLEQSISLVRGSRYDSYALGGVDTLFGVGAFRETQPIEIYPQIAVTSTLLPEDLQLLNAYLLEPGQTVADRESPNFLVAAGLVSENLRIFPGAYDLVLTRPEQTTPVADPIPLNLANGDLVRFVLFETSDPNLVDVQPQP